MTDEAGCTAASEDPEADQPPPPKTSLTALAVFPASADLPLDPGLFLAMGLLLLFVGALVVDSLQTFSPSRLRKRIDKSRDDDGAGTDQAELERELHEADAFVPSAVIVEFLGLSLAVLGALALFDGATLWPSGFWGVALLFFLVVLFGGILPARIAEQRADTIVFRSLPLLRPLRVLLIPIAWPLGHVARFFTRNIFGIRAELDNGRDNLADEIRAAVEDSDETEQLADEEKEWIENIVDFRSEDSAGIMTPRTDMMCVESKTPLSAAIEKAVEAGHSRLPVFEEKLDNVVGIFYLRDAVKLMPTSTSELLEAPVSEHMRAAYFVPESKKVNDLLREFRRRRVQIAVVVDEYGGTAGLVSIEDILEEIVGEIEDEYDPEREDPLDVRQDGRFAEVDAKVRIGDLNESCQAELPESEDYETVGGFVFSQLGRIPRIGESFQWKNVEFTVLGADARRVTRLRLNVLEPESNSA